MLPRGMKDLSGRELAGITYVRNVFERMAHMYDYTPVHPSPLELVQTLETKSGPAIRDEIYNFADKGGREVGLRFDFTMGLTRHAVADRSKPLPRKISSFGGVFRYDEPQKNRYRYFHQWDIEVYGKPHISQDVEIIEFTSKFLDSLPVPHTIRISHRAIMESYIVKHFGQEGVNDMLRAVDKMQKKKSRDIIDEFGKKGYDESRLDDLLEFARTCGTPDDVKSRIEPQMYSYMDNLSQCLNSMGVTSIVVDFGIVRGLDYYTGMVFEAYGTKSNSALAGGGRYDMLPGAFGWKEMGAAGVAGGVERIVSTMNSHNIPIQKKRISVIYVGEQMLQAAAALASALRQKNIPTHMDVANRPLKKQIASAKDSTTFLIVAPSEMDEGDIILRDMSSGSQSRIPYSDIMKEPLRFIPEMP